MVAMKIWKGIDKEELERKL